MRVPKIERILAATIAGVVAAMTSGPALADAALEQSCQMLAVLGGNQVEEVAPTLGRLAGRWPEQNITGATEQLTQMLGQIAFAGGNVYELGRLGDDLVEHLIVLRLAEGETAGMQLSYEWTPEGLALTRMDFKLNYTTELGLEIPIGAAPESCP